MGLPLRLVRPWGRPTAARTACERRGAPLAAGDGIKSKRPGIAAEPSPMRGKELVLFPIRVDDAVMETPEPWARRLRDQRNVGDFRRWKDHDAYKQSFERVLRDLTKSQEPK
jgi:hypothetical protein